MKDKYWDAVYRPDNPRECGILTEDDELVLDVLDVDYSTIAYIVGIHNNSVRDRREPRRLMFSETGDRFEMLVQNKYNTGEALHKGELKITVVKGNKRTRLQKFLNRIYKKWYPEINTIKVEHERD